ncbi:MAG: hypothetical protein M1829_005299 [Trizodia sp. TS-e1964]|nr:MAG: hypothetical protein M1829_005299 [Trizodia sp. TS-e1964]
MPHSLPSWPWPQRPGRTSASSCRCLTLAHLLFTLAILLSCCCSMAQAQGTDVPVRDSLLQSTLERLARKGEILVDQRPSPVAADLRRRQDSTPSASSSAAAAPTPTSLPVPFDTSIGANYTSQACPNFFQRFLANTTFTSCAPLSLMLQNSNSFFQAQKSVVRLTQALDASCNANFKLCVATMADLARQIQQDQNCGQDFRNQQPLVLQAYNGLVSYSPLYYAGCLKASNGNYCFANAATNASSPTDSYPYYLPLGIAMPGGSHPTCSTCLQNTMALFSNAASNASQPISQTYVQAAQLIDISCGPTFINTTIPAATSFAARSSSMSPLLGVIITIALLASTNLP